MLDFKLHDAMYGLLLFMVGQWLGLNVPQVTAARGQDVAVYRSLPAASGSPAIDVADSKNIANPVAQPVAAAPAAAVLFCVKGDRTQPLCFTVADLAKLPRTTLTVRDRDGTPIAYEGVLLAEVLRRAGVPQGEQLRGANLARYLVVDGADGYAVVFGLPEFDPAFGNRVVLLADRRDGHALASDEAPLRLVIPGDQRRARWVRKITQMRVIRATTTP